MNKRKNVEIKLFLLRLVVKKSWYINPSSSIFGRRSCFQILEEFCFDGSEHAPVPLKRSAVSYIPWGPARLCPPGQGRPQFPHLCRHLLGRWSLLLHRSDSYRPAASASCTGSTACCSFSVSLSIFLFPSLSLSPKNSRIPLSTRHITSNKSTAIND